MAPQRVGDVLCLGTSQAGLGQRGGVEGDEQQHGLAALVVVGDELGEDRPDAPQVVGRGLDAVAEPRPHLAGQLLLRGEQQVGLGAEVVLHQGDRHAGLGGDLAERGRAQPRRP